MNTQEHILAIAEPTPGGDSTIDVANASIARGGQATVVVLLTDRVIRDIEAFAASEDLGWGEASALAFEQIGLMYAASTTATLSYLRSVPQLFDQLRSLVTPEITSIALPEQLVVNFPVEAFAASFGVPVTITPSATSQPLSRRSLVGTAI